MKFLESFSVLLDFKDSSSQCTDIFILANATFYDIGRRYDSSPIHLMIFAFAKKLIADLKKSMHDRMKA